MNSSLWLTWETQRRNPELAAAFEAEYCCLDYSGHHISLRYLCSLLSTIRCLLNKRTGVVFAQCPSVILVALVACFKVFRGFVFVIDAHNIAFEYLRSDNVLLRSLSSFAFRQADVILVSNLRLSSGREELDDKRIALPDRLPSIDQNALPERFQQLSRPLITLICSFADDEPIEVFLEAIQTLEYGGTLLVSGKKSRAGDLLRYESDKICFTDFLPNLEFESLIQHSDLLVDLTTRDDCLVCGAYEALAVGRPVLLSKTGVQQEVFGKGAIFSENTPDSYREAVSQFLKQPAVHRRAAESFKADFEARWQVSFESARSKIYNKFKDI